MAVAGPRTPVRLTPSEQRIVVLMADGHAPKQIAWALGVSVETVRTHLKNAKRRTESKTLAELVANYGPNQQIARPERRLTPRQLQVGSMLADGQSFSEIADALEISPRTVEMHVTAAKERLGNVTTSQLAAALLVRGEHFRRRAVVGDDSSTASVSLAAQAAAQATSMRGAEVVELSESLLARLFGSAVVLVAFSSAAALVLRLITTHPGEGWLGQPSPVLVPLVLAGVLPLAAVVILFLGARSAAALVGRSAAFQLSILVCAAVLVVDPRAELWWPASALLMLLVVAAPPRRTLVCCSAAVLVSAGAQLLHDGLASALSVSNITVWFDLTLLPVAALVVGQIVTAALLASNPHAG